MAGAGWFVAQHDVVQFDIDEGFNLMKALLTQRGQRLYVEVWSDQPPLLTWLLGAVVGPDGGDVAAVRQAMLAFAGCLVFALYDALRVLRGHAAALAGVLLLACAASVVRLSGSVMVGLPAIAFAMLALRAQLAWTQGAPRGWLALAGALLGLSLCTKLFTGLVIVPAVLACVLVARRKPGGGRGAPALWFGALLGTVALVLGWALAPATLSQLYAAHLGADVVGRQPSHHWFMLLRADWQLHALAAMGTIAAARRRERFVVLPTLWWLSAVVMLLVHRPLWYHHAPLATVPACLLGGLAIAELARGGLREARWLRAAVLIVCVALSVSVARGRKAPRMPQPELVSGQRALLEALRPYAARARVVVADSPLYPFVLGLPVPAELAVPSNKRVVTGQLPLATIVAAIQRERPEVILLTDHWPTEVDDAVASGIAADYRLVHQQQEPDGRIYVRADLVAADPAR